MSKFATSRSFCHARASALSCCRHPMAAPDFSRDKTKIVLVISRCRTPRRTSSRAKCSGEMPLSVLYACHASHREFINVAATIPLHFRQSVKSEKRLSCEADTDASSWRHTHMDEAKSSVSRTCSSHSSLKNRLNTDVTPSITRPGGSSSGI